MAAHTLAEAQEMLSLWKECERQLASGQAKRYRVGTREFEAVDLPYIISRINYYANQVAQLSGAKRATRVVRVVPRDL
ncbi:MAG: hypothetical protein E7322_05700 [Clostridiales bacterium]|nr:hypothetical protein [Clostridiales bacterium]